MLCKFSRGDLKIISLSQIRNNDKPKEKKIPYKKSSMIDQWAFRNYFQKHEWIKTESLKDRDHIFNCKHEAESKNRNQEVKLHTLKAHPQWHASNKAVCPKPLQRVLSTGKQALKHLNLWGTFFPPPGMLLCNF